MNLVFSKPLPNPYSESPFLSFHLSRYKAQHWQNAMKQQVKPGAQVHTQNIYCGKVHKLF